MKSPSAAKSMMAGKRSCISARDTPRMAPLRAAFSRPVNSGLKPAPGSSRAKRRPFTLTRPAVGRSVPAMSWSSVDFPEPFRPMTPGARRRREAEPPPAGELPQHQHTARTFDRHAERVHPDDGLGPDGNLLRRVEHGTEEVQRLQADPDPVAEVPHEDPQSRDQPAQAERPEDERH